MIGTLLVGGNPTYVLFDSGATHSFVTPEVVGKFEKAFEEVKISYMVHTAKNQVLRAEGVLKEVPITVQD